MPPTANNFIKNKNYQQSFKLHYRAMVGPSVNLSQLPTKFQATLSPFQNHLFENHRLDVLSEGAHYMSFEHVFKLHRVQE